MNRPEGLSDYEDRLWTLIGEAVTNRKASATAAVREHRDALRAIFEALDARETWTPEDVKALLRRWL